MSVHLLTTRRDHRDGNLDKQQERYTYTHFPSTILLKRSNSTTLRYSKSEYQLYLHILILFETVRESRMAEQTSSSSNFYCFNKSIPLFFEIQLQVHFTLIRLLNNAIQHKIALFLSNGTNKNSAILICQTIQLV